MGARGGTFAATFPCLNAGSPAAVSKIGAPAASFITGQIVAVDGGRMVLDPLTSLVR